MRKLGGELHVVDERRELYPEIEPYQTGRLQVSNLHNIHYELVGDPKGEPAVVLHGGPGAGIEPIQRRYFDPRHYNVMLFDQRGCGKSTPHASLVDNTTWHLVSDMERLRNHLGIRKWLVFGGSWGSALAMAYAQTHPDHVTGLILRGVFMLRRMELMWFYQEGACFIFPDEWEKFLAPIPESERGDLISAYYKRLTSEDRKSRLRAARAWSTWEGATLSLLPDPRRVAYFSGDRFAEAFARIECHYFRNRGFFHTDGQLLDRAYIIRQIPTTIVHGRYDVCTPFRNAWELHLALPVSELHVVSDAGHAATEPGIIHALVTATDKFRSMALLQT